MSFFTKAHEDTISQPKQLTISNHFDLVRSIITRRCLWFIAGGSLLVDNGDLDIYFYRGQDFITALYRFNHNNDVRRSSHSDLDETFPNASSKTKSHFHSVHPIPARRRPSLRSSHLKFAKSPA